MDDFYQSGGPCVDFYDQHFEDLSRTEFANDIEFYREWAKHSGGPILELGCGTGRVSIPLALDGHEVVGIDRSQFMLQIAERKNVSAGTAVDLRLGDMTALKLERSFALVIVAFGAFHHLLTTEEQLRCLGCIHQHLVPGGQLLMHLRNLDPGEMALAMAQGAPVRQLSATDRATGHKVISEGALVRIDPLHQVVVEQWLHSEFDTLGTVVSRYRQEFSLRWTAFFEMEHMLARVGLQPTSCFGDFSRGPVVDQRQHIWVARRVDGFSSLPERDRRS
jgi:SAM-dependent methyltransferase